MIKYATSKALILASALVLSIGFSSCRKNKVIPEALAAPASVPTGGNTKQTPTTNRLELSNDSLFLYAQQIYLWNTTLPTYDDFNPRMYKNFGTDLDNLNTELFNITKYSGFETVPNANYSKFAFIAEENLSAGNLSIAQNQQANLGYQEIGNDLGILDLRGFGTSTNYKMYVMAVYRNSPADLAGITRGTRITSINGRAIGTNVAAESGVINVLVDGLSTTTVSCESTDGRAFEVTLNVARYTGNPIFKAKVIDQGGKKIGYLAYAHFGVLTNANNANPSDSRLDPVFASFAASGVTDLVIDLRYNGGGLVQSAEYILNQIVPANSAGILYQEVYNATMKNGQATILKNQPLTDANGKIVYKNNGQMATYNDVDFRDAANVRQVNKKGPLTGVKNIVFLVTEFTASASELLINGIKPYVQSVQLIGRKTYGKPVGFFPIVIANRYSVYLPSFEIKNKNGDGGYYNGITPNYIEDPNIGLIDDNRYDFGDPRESYLNKALSLLAPVAPAALSSLSTLSGPTARVAAAKSMPMNRTHANISGTGMIETRYQLKN
ncbi:S41 family peptidase [Pedobacter gandavensis]|uniref:S41 family peptidase n=1 Tax=Pedobacter gandavensis TaxID=2679963 RepID=UPI00292DDB76|nr:S41 family peptidase [Pedobacter gandavensis]